MDTRDKRLNIRKLTQLSMFLTIALIIFTLEAQIPPLVPIAGVKPGLANIITLVVISLYGKRDAFFVLVLRIFLSCAFAGGFSMFLYSAAGGILSFAVMAVLYPLLGIGKLWVISVFGAIFHNVGQIAVAIVVTGTVGIIWYFPPLLVSGIIAGAFTGITAQLLLKRVRKILKL